MPFYLNEWQRVYFRFLNFSQTPVDFFLQRNSVYLQIYLKLTDP